MEERILGTSTVTENYRVTLLNAVRPHIKNIEKGEAVVFVLNKDGEVVIRKA